MYRVVYFIVIQRQNILNWKPLRKHAAIKTTENANIYKLLFYLNLIAFANASTMEELLICTKKKGIIYSNIPMD